MIEWQDTREKSNYGKDWRKKAHDMIPQKLIINCLKIVQDIRGSHKVYSENMKTGRAELTAGEKSLAKVKI